MARSKGRSSGEAVDPVPAPQAAISEHALDRQLIAALQRDGRLTNIALARMFGVSEAAVRQRLKRLHETRAIRASAIADLTYMGLGHVALVRLNVAPDALPWAIETLGALDNFTYVAVTTGTHNIAAFSLTDTAASLSRILDERVRPNPAVRNVDVRAVISAVKFDSSTAFI